MALENAYGKDNFSWHMLNVSLASRIAMDKIIVLFDKGDLNTASVEAVERDYQTAFDNADAFTRAHPDVKTSAGHSPVWFSFSGDFNNFLVEMKAMRRALAKNPDKSEMGFMVSKLLKEYNHMIRNYNMIGATRF